MPAAAVATGTATLFITSPTPPPFWRAVFELEDGADRGVLFRLLDPFPRDRELLARELLARDLLARELWLREVPLPEVFRLRADALLLRPLDEDLDDPPDDRFFDAEPFPASAIPCSLP